MSTGEAAHDRDRTVMTTYSRKDARMTIGGVEIPISTVEVFDRFTPSSRVRTTAQRRRDLRRALVRYAGRADRSLRELRRDVLSQARHAGARIPRSLRSLRYESYTLTATVRLPDSWKMRLISPTEPTSPEGTPKSHP